jgi:hypothetical protein
VLGWPSRAFVETQTVRQVAATLVAAAVGGDGDTMKQGLAAFVLVVGALIGAGVPAQATPGACVSPGEYRQVHRGMTRHHVRQIFDTRGRRSAFFRRGGFTSEIRRYRGCPRHSAVSIAYGNGRVRTKSASWS